MQPPRPDERRANTWSNSTNSRTAPRVSVGDAFDALLPITFFKKGPEMELKQLDDAQLLERLTIPSPCTVPWDTMHGDDRARFCEECELTVYNLAALTKEQAGQLIRANEGRLCARIYRRHDGTILTADCNSENSRPLFSSVSHESQTRIRVARPFQFSLRMVFAFTLLCATCLGIVRIIPQSWITVAASWFEREPPKPVNLAAPPLLYDEWEGGDICIDD